MATRSAVQTFFYTSKRMCALEIVEWIPDELVALICTFLPCAFVRAAPEALGGGSDISTIEPQSLPKRSRKQPDRLGFTTAAQPAAGELRSTQEQFYRR